MTYVKINETLYPATIYGKATDGEWDGRESKAINLEMSYEDVKDIFVNDIAWAIVYQAEPQVNESGETVTPDPVEYDNSEYCVAGSITDHRDGTITVKMGKMTDLEEVLALVYGGAE